MKKHVFLQLNIGYIALTLFYFFCFAGAILLCVFVFVADISIFIKLFSTFLPFVFLAEVFSLHSYYIVIDMGQIITKGSFLCYDKGVRTQYPLIVDIKDITNIKIIYSSLNSKKEATRNLKAPITFFEFELINGKKKWLDINGVAKKDRVKFLEIINQHLGTEYEYYQMARNKEKRN